MIAAYTPPRVPAPGGNSRCFGQPYLTGGKEARYNSKSFAGFAFTGTYKIMVWFVILMGLKLTIYRRC